MAYNSVQTLEAELPGESEQYTAVDLERKLEQARQRVNNTVGRKFIEYKTVKFGDKRDIDLEFESLNSFDQVEDVNDNNLVDEANYNTDFSTGTVTFDEEYVDDNFFRGLDLKFYYTPKIFETLELFYAVRNILETQTIVTSDDISSTRTERLNNRITSMVNRVNSVNSVTVQRGDNQNRGSEAPDDFSE